MNSGSSLSKYAPKDADYSKKAPWRVVTHPEGLQFVASGMLNATKQLELSHLRIRVNLGMSDAATSMTNRVKQFFKALKTYKKCTNLDLAHCQISDMCCREHLVPMIQNNEVLVFLDLSANAFTDVGADMIFTALIKSNISSLNFARNAITKDSMEAAANAIETDRFTSVDFSFTEVGAAGLKLILPAMEDKNLLKSLNLESAKLGDEGCLELAKKLSTGKLVSIKDLNLAENEIGRQGVEKLVANFVPGGGKEELLSLDLSKNYFGDQGLDFIIDMMKANEKLESLKMNKVGITMPKVVTFCEKMIVRYNQEFGPYPNLKKFEIGNNGLGNDFGTLLTMIQNKNCTIKALGYDGNEVTNFGAKLFKEWMLKSFDCNRKAIEEKAGELEADEIKAERKKIQDRRENFTKLTLKSNLIDSDGCEHLAEIVKGNSIFSELDIRKNKIGVKGAIWFKKAFRKLQCSKKTFDCVGRSFRLHVMPADVGVEGVNHLSIGIRQHPEEIRAWVKEVAAKKRKQYEEKMQSTSAGKNVNNFMPVYLRSAALDNKWKVAKSRQQEQEKTTAALKSGVVEEIPGAIGVSIDLAADAERAIEEKQPEQKRKETTDDFFANLVKYRRPVVNFADKVHLGMGPTKFSEFDTPMQSDSNINDITAAKARIRIVGQNDEKEDEWRFVTWYTFLACGVGENDRGVLKWSGGLYKYVKKGWGAVLGNTLYRWSLLLRMQYEAETDEYVKDLYLQRYRRGGMLQFMMKVDCEPRDNLIARLVSDDLKNFWEILMHQTSTKSEGLTMLEFALKYSDSPVIDCLRQFLNVFPAAAFARKNSKSPAVFLQQKIAHSGKTYKDLCLASTDRFVRRYAEAKKLFFFRFLEVEPVYISKFNRVSKVEDLLLTEEYEDKERFFYMRRIANTGAANDENLGKNEFETHKSFMDNNNSYLSGGNVTYLDVVENNILQHVNSTLDADFIPQISQLFHRKQMLSDDKLMPTFTNMYKTNLREVLDNESLAGGRDLARAQIMLKMIGNSLLHFNDRKWVRAFAGASELSKKGRIHGNVKPRNIVLRIGDELPDLDNAVGLLPGKWVLTDFCRSTVHGDDYFPAKDSAYNPPEVAKRLMSSGERHLKVRIEANQAMDVWQFGCVLFEVLSGTTLFKMEGNTDTVVDEEERGELINWLSLDEERSSLILNQLKSQSSNSYRNTNISMSLNSWAGYDDETIQKVIESGKQLVQWCLQGRPEDRPSFAEILSHPFLRDVDVGRRKGEIEADSCLPVPATAFDNSNFLETQPHLHLVNTDFEQAGLIIKSLEESLGRVGCRLTTDSMSGSSGSPEQYEKELRKNVESARIIACLLTRDAFYKPNVVKQLLFAEDGRRRSEKVHGRVLFLDLSAGLDLTRDNLTFSKPDFTKGYIQSDEFQYLVKAMAMENPKLSRFSVNNFAYDDRFDAWKTVLNTDFRAMVLSYLQEPIKYQPEAFLKEPMLDKMLSDGHLVPTSKISSFGVSSLSSNNFRDKDDVLNKKLEDRKQKFMNLYFLPANKVKKGVIRSYVLCADDGSDEMFNAVSEIARTLEAPSALNTVAESEMHKDKSNPRNKLFNKVKTSYNIKKSSHLKIGGRSNVLQKGKDAVLNVSREEGGLLLVFYCTNGVFTKYSSFLKEAVAKRGDDGLSIVLVKGIGFNVNSREAKAEIEAHVPEELKNQFRNKDNYTPYFKPKKDPWQAEAAMNDVLKKSVHKIEHPKPKETFVA